MVRQPVDTADDTNPSAADVALYVLKASLFDASGDGVSNRLCSFRGEIVGRTGGGATKLDGITTTVLTAGRTCFIIRIAGSGEGWVLEADAVTAADGQWIVDPVDFNAMTNAKKWKRIF